MTNSRPAASDIRAGRIDRCAGATIMSRPRRRAATATKRVPMPQAAHRSLSRRQPPPRGALAAVAAVFTLAPLPSVAQSSQQPMTIGLVRAAHPGCDALCPEFIAMQGVVQPDSHEKLKLVFQALKDRRLPIIVHSPGGNVDAGLAIAAMIRARRLDVGVALAEYADACAGAEPGCAAREKGRPPARRLDFTAGACSSACTLILAGGVKRVVVPGARIGVHQMSTSETERVVERVYADDRRTGQRRVVSEQVVSERTSRVEQDPAIANRGVAKHFADMGLPRTITELTLSTPPEQIRVLSTREIAESRIATHMADPLATLGLGPPR
jgi:hypothetical protein